MLNNTVTKLNILAKDSNQYSFAHQEYQTYYAGEELDISDELKQGFWDTFESFSKWTVNRNTKVEIYEDMVKI